MDEYLISHLFDLKKESEEKDYCTYSSFLGLSEQAKINKYAPSLLSGNSSFYFSQENGERVILMFLPSYWTKEEAISFVKPITLLRIYPRSEKFASFITHRDVLGAILSLGIERDTIGDIIIHKKEAYVYLLSSIVQEVLNNLTSVKNNPIKIEELSTLDCPYSPLYQEKTISVPSNRLDVILSEVFPTLSREDAKKHIEAGNAYSSVHETLKNDTKLENEEVISLRGFGKFCYLGEDGISKKGKLRIKIKKPK